MATVSLNAVLALELDIFWWYFLWWLPAFIALSFSVKKGIPLEGDAEKQKPFFSSIIKVSYLTMALPVFMNLIVFLVFIYPRKDNGPSMTIVCGLFYYFFNIPGLIYFLKDQFRKKQGFVNLEESPVFNQLSSREQDVVRLLVKGRKYSEISDELYISLSTVKKHTNNIYRKTGTSSARLLIRKLQQR